MRFKTKFDKETMQDRLDQRADWKRETAFLRIPSLPKFFLKQIAKRRPA